MNVQGASIRKVAAIVRKLCRTSVSPAQVSRFATLSEVQGPSESLLHHAPNTEPPRGQAGRQRRSGQVGCGPEGLLPIGALATLSVPPPAEHPGLRAPPRPTAREWIRRRPMVRHEDLRIRGPSTAWRAAGRHDSYPNQADSYLRDSTLETCVILNPEDLIEHVAVRGEAACLCNMPCKLPIIMKQGKNDRIKKLSLAMYVFGMANH